MRKELRKKEYTDKIIDIHTHIAYRQIYSQTFLDEVTKEFLEKGLSKKKVNSILNKVLSDFDGDRLIQQMDEAGIEKSVLLCTDFDFKKNDTPYSVREIHQLCFDQIRKHNDRFIAFAGVSPFRVAEDYSIAAKYIEKYDFKGIKMYPPIGFELTDDKLKRYYELCNEYSLPVLIHTGPSIKGFLQISNFEKDVCFLANTYKKAKFVLAHAAIKDHRTGIRMAVEYENVFLDISSFQSEIHNKTALKERLSESLETIPKKVIFGTDWPMYNFFVSQKSWVSLLEEILPEDEELRARLFYKNAQHVLMNTLR